MTVERDHGASSTQNPPPSTLLTCLPVSALMRRRRRAHSSPPRWTNPTLMRTSLLADHTMRKTSTRSRDFTPAWRRRKRSPRCASSSESRSSPTESRRRSASTRTAFCGSLSATTSSVRSAPPAPLASRMASARPRASAQRSVAPRSARPTRPSTPSGTAGQRRTSVSGAERRIESGGETGRLPTRMTTKRVMRARWSGQRPSPRRDRIHRRPRTSLWQLSKMSSVFVSAGAGSARSASTPALPRPSRAALCASLSERTMLASPSTAWRSSKVRNADFSSLMEQS